MIMLFKGFGCFVFLCTSLAVNAKEIHGNSTSQKNDTSIATTEIVVAAALSSPSGSADNAGKLTAKSTTPKTVVLTKTMLTKQNNYSGLHPMSVAFVRAYEKKHEVRLEKIISRYERQLTQIDKIMIRHELPTDLKYLALIESEMFNGAGSRKGAVGPWQFMAPTGR